mmetsp:Transcript_25509/g.59820  ORF Transcript_25509/g.59820 Transcript_25509/m.59820 type:complete len:223 (+) Transcript_25509:590-1258(+)
MAEGLHQLCRGVAAQFQRIDPATFLSKSIDAQSLSRGSIRALVRAWQPHFAQRRAAKFGGRHLHCRPFPVEQHVELVAGIEPKKLQALGGNAREAQWPQRLREVHRAAHRLRRVHTRPQAFPNPAVIDGIDGLQYRGRSVVLYPCYKVTKRSQDIERLVHRCHRGPNKLRRHVPSIWSLRSFLHAAQNGLLVRSDVEYGNVVVPVLRTDPLELLRIPFGILE